LSDAVKFIF